MVLEINTDLWDYKISQDAETTQNEAEAEDVMQTLEEVPSAVGAMEGTGANSSPKPGESR